MTDKKTFCLVALGCDKNTVDSELMLSELQKKYTLVTEMQYADIIVVNTCGFIESAQQESIDCILEAAEYRKSSACALIVTGCLAQLFAKELMDEIDEIDACLGVTSAADITETVERVVKGERFINVKKPTLDGCYEQRTLSTPGYTAYVKIAEGCSNGCSYCLIPRIRGGLKSRTMENIELEVKCLAERGVKEIVLVAQDTTRYGEDIYGECKIAELLERLAATDVKWIRLLYCYPESITPELIDVMTRHENIVKYIDMPVQHLSDEILMRMRRRSTYEQIENAVGMIRAADASFILRTTIIVGYPGETEEIFEELLEKLQKLEFDRLGVFVFSEQEGTLAAKQEPKVPPETAEERLERVMLLQQEISLRRDELLIGTRQEALVEGYDMDRFMDVARPLGQTRDVDGQTYFFSERELEAGEITTVKIEKADEYDLYAREI